MDIIRVGPVASQESAGGRSAEGAARVVAPPADRAPQGLSGAHLWGDLDEEDRRRHERPSLHPTPGEGLAAVAAVMVVTIGMLVLAVGLAVGIAMALRGP